MRGSRHGSASEVSDGGGAIEGEDGVSVEAAPSGLRVHVICKYRDELLAKLLATFRALQAEVRGCDGVCAPLSKAPGLH